ncbi:MAG: hypothetical protein EHM42_02610 [Planctomycetaceae bacterium]|nr:MAG: hypothetical protein EHM42_02610 [Planctomycetaceae bacterium]
MAGPVRWRVSHLGWALVVGLSGCGSDTYEERLETTAKYFASIQLQNENLSRPWTDSATTISLRVPLQFQELPPPDPNAAENAEQSAPTNPGMPQGAGSEPAQDEEEEGEESEEVEEDSGVVGNAAAQPITDDLPFDPRQPTYLNTPLPGLRGAFKASVGVIGQGNRVVPASGYLYVFSNHYLAGNQDAAARFHNDLTLTLAGALGVLVQPSDSRELHLPKRPDAFVKPTTYTEIEIEPAEQGDELAREFGIATRFSLYLISSGEVQMAVLFVLPRDLDNAERFPLRKLLSLETLRIDSSQLLKPGGGGSAVPGTSSGNAF